MYKTILPVWSARLLVVALVAGFSVIVSAQDAPVRLIFDTDMDTDCDDLAALAMVHALNDNGEIDLLATMVSSRYPWSGPCVSAINTYFGHPEMPVGVPHGRGNVEAGDDRTSKYAPHIAEEFPHDFPMAGGKPNMESAPDAAKLYRKILAEQPDDSVTIVTVGYLTNIRYLLESEPDEYSDLNGKELTAKKVKEWVCMGSRYPADLDPNPWGNFKPDPDSTVIAVEDWPSMLTFTGGGDFANSLSTGEALRQLPDDNPVKRGYEFYFGGQAKDRHSADQIATCIAARGTGAPWELVTEGYNHIFPNGTHEWRLEPNHPKQQYISALQEGAEAQDVVSQFEELMLHTP